MKADTGLVDTQGRPLKAKPVPKPSEIVHAAKGSAPRPWRRADSVMTRRRTDGALTRKARKAQARVARLATQYGVTKR